MPRDHHPLKGEDMPNQTIDIELGPSYTLYTSAKVTINARKIGVHPARQPAARGDGIAFNLVPGDGRTFTVIFPDGSPFDTDEVHARGTQTPFIFVTTAHKRSFHYSVAIATPTEVHILATGAE